MNNSNSNKSLIIMGSVAAASIISYFIYRHFKQSKETKKETPAEVVSEEKTQEDTKTVEPAVSEPTAEVVTAAAVEFSEESEELPVPKDTMIKIFNDISDSAQSILGALGQQEQAISAQFGGNSELVAQFLSAQFNTELTKAEKAVYVNYNVDEEAVVKSSAILADDIDFKRSVYPLKNIASILTNQTPDDGHDLIPEDMTPKRYIAIFEQVTEITIDCLQETIDKFVKDKNLQSVDELKAIMGEDNQLQNDLMLSFLTLSNEKKEEIFAKNNIDRNIFQICLSYYGNTDEDFGEELKKITAKYQPKIANLL